MYTSVNGFYSVNSLSKNRLYYLLKTENKIKTAKITSKGLIEMSYDLIQKRHQLKLTQKDVAVIIGVSAATYSYYECAKVTPKKDKLRLLINFINS
jgi:DNA-binding XRE family transcriptional regulator